MHSRQLLILQQNPDHLAQPQIRPERQFPNAIAILIRMAIIPKFLFQILPVAAHRLQSRPGDLQHHRRIPQAPILRIEMIARSPIANKCPIHTLRRSKNFPSRQIRPIPRADQPAGLHPIQRPIKRRRNRSPALRRNAQQIRRPHPVAQTIAQTIHLAVIRPHPLLHNLRRNAHHVRITYPPPLDNPHNLPPRRQFPNQRLKAKYPRIRSLERIQNRRRRIHQRPRRIILHAKSLPIRPAILKRRRQRSRHLPRRLIKYQNHALPRHHRKTSLHGVPRPIHQFRIHRIKNNRRHIQSFYLDYLFPSSEPFVSPTLSSIAQTRSRTQRGARSFRTQGAP